MNHEIVVIGSGPGGAITAHSLAKAGRDVLLIEEGVEASASPFSLRELRLKYRHKGQTIAFGNPNIQYVEGCCLGGGSEINSGLYHRLPELIRQRWEQRLQIRGFSATELQKHYLSIESIVAVQTAPIPSKASLKLLIRSQKLQWKVVELPRWIDREGNRHSMSKTYLREFIKAGGKLEVGKKVIRLHRSRGKWHLKTAEMVITASTVFVCGGAIQTPALLRRSGITRRIGNDLSLHPTMKLTAVFDEEVNGEDGGGVPIHQIKEFAPEISLGGSVSTLPHLMAAYAHHPAFPGWFQEHWKHLFTYYAQIAGESRGKVRLLPGCDSPYISYSLSDKDRETLAFGLKKLAELLLAAGAKELITSDAVHIKNPAQLPEKINSSAIGVMTIHLCGSCPMGENRMFCATDSYGKVHGVEHLYISDASLLGGSPTVNPQGIIMATARRNAYHFLGKDT